MAAPLGTRTHERTGSVDLGLPIPHGLDGIPRLAGDAKHTKKDFASDQEVRWCPGCGDYIILNTVQSFLPELGLRKENLVFVSGIGCSSRFPYYLDTYGMHSIHGRAPAIATGLATARPDLSEQGKITKSTPAGSVDMPFNPVSLALGAEATFVARSLDNDRAHLSTILRAAAAHRGTALVEIYQNCPIFNDGAFDLITDRDQQQARLIHLEDGQPVHIGGEDNRKILIRTNGGKLVFVPAAEAHSDSADVVIHNASDPDPSQQFAISRLDDTSMMHVPMGIFRQVQRPTYDDLVRGQIETALASAGAPAADADLAQLIAGRDTWTVV